MPTPKTRYTLMEAQQAAVKFSRDYLSKTPLGLADRLSDEEFKAAMDAISRALIQAWGDGYYTGRSGK
jgi:hypothetical protein